MTLNKIYAFAALMLLLVTLITITMDSLKAQVTYEYWWGGVNNDHGYAIAKTPDGNFILVGATNSFGVGTPDYTNAFISKISGSTGEAIWSIWFGTSSYDDEAYDVAIDSLGNIYVVGLYGNSGFLLSLDPSGTPRWASTFSGEAHGVAVDSNGNVYVVGRIIDPDGLYGCLLLSFSSDGSLRFSKIYYQSDAERLTKVAVSPNGHVYAVGHRQYSIAGTPYYRIIVLNISRTDGSLNWQRYIGYGANYYGWSLTVDEGENTYIAGSFGEVDVLIIKYSSALNIENIKRIDLGGDNDEGRGIAVDSSGNVYIAGFTNGVGEGLHDYLVLKYDSSFNLVWAKSWGTSGEDYGRAIILRGSNILVFGGAAATTGNLADQTAQVKDDFDLSASAKTDDETLITTSGPTPEALSLTQGSNWDYINTLESGGIDAVLLSLSSQGEPTPIPEHYNPLITAISIIAAITIISYVAKRK